MSRVALLIAALVMTAGAERVARAYPQYHLARDQTCTSCHLSPAGGELLNENGLAIADSTAQWGGAPGFLHDVLDPPSWLQLGGDARAAAGLFQDRGTAAAAYPMQGEIYAAATAGHGFSLDVTAGLRAPLDGGSLLHVLWSREHFVMWQQHPDQGDGLYIRAGRFMPVYGLRLAEHVVYTERYGGLPLFGEAYGVAVEYVTPAFEVHATGFVHDPIATAVEHGDGGAFYGELRITEHGAVGIEGKYSASDELHTTFAGMTGKAYIPQADLLLQTELEVARDHVVAGGAATRLMGYLLATRPITDGWLLDVGVGHYTQDTSVAGLYRDALDVNLHWFTTSHIELVLNARFEVLDHGAGPIGGYEVLQLHYRL